MPSRALAARYGSRGEPMFGSGACRRRRPIASTQPYVNLGPASARSHGVQLAAGELILFVDDDVVAFPTLVDEHVATHVSEGDAVVIGPMSPPCDWPRPIWVQWEENKLLSQYRAMIAGEWGCTARQFYTGN